MKGFIAWDYEEWVFIEFDEIWDEKRPTLISNHVAIFNELEEWVDKL